MRVGYATDLGFVPTPVREALLGCSTVVLESNHDPEMLRTGPYPYALQQRVAGPRGHLSNPDCAKLAVELVDVYKRQAYVPQSAHEAGDHTDSVDRVGYGDHGNLFGQQRRQLLLKRF